MTKVWRRPQELLNAPWTFYKFLTKDLGPETIGFISFFAILLIFDKGLEASTRTLERPLDLLQIFDKGFGASNHWLYKPFGDFADF